MTRVAFVLWMFVASMSVVVAQVPPDTTSGGWKRDPWSYGLSLGVSTEAHLLDIPGLPGVPNCCAGYSNTLAWTPSIDLVGDVEIADLWRVAGKLGYYSSAMELTTREYEAVNTDGSRQQGEFDHVLNVQRHYLTLTADLLRERSERWNVFVGVRAQMLVGGSYWQVERLVEPYDAVYENGTRERLYRSGSPIPGEAGLVMGAHAGVRLDIPLTEDDGWQLHPELLFEWNVNSRQTDQSWNVAALRFSCALSRHNVPEPPPVEVTPITIEKPIEPPTVQREIAQRPKTRLETAVPPFVLLIDSLGATLQDTAGKPLPTQELTVYNIVSLNLYALLSFIFFDEDSDVIPDRYRMLTPQQAEEYQLRSLNGQGTFNIYRDMLNIVGFKMRENPADNITLTGCNSNDGQEMNNLALSQRRAEAIRDYLVRVWDINESRIQIQARNLPEVPSNITNNDGREENRRVEIVSTGNKILEPLFFDDTTRSVSADRLAFTPAVRTDVGLRNWQVNVYQGATILDSVAGIGNVPDTVYWNLGRNPAVYPKTNEQLFYTMAVQDSAGQSIERLFDGCAVRQVVRREKRVEKFSLIIFAFNESEFTKQHNEILKLIKDRILPTSTVTVEGHTDRSGNPDYNLRLSNRRAASVATRLKIPDERVFGYGDTRAIFDNDYPEGRLYSRTVIITIETPLD